MVNSIGYIFLKEKELLTLLRAAGTDKWYGPHYRETDIIGKREDLNRVLAGLYRKGAVTWENGMAKINPYIEKGIRTIINSEVCILCGSRDEGSHLTYVYPYKEGIACLSASEHDENSMRLAVMSFDEWITELEISGFFPEQIGQSPQSPEIITNEADSVMELRDNNTGDILAQIHIVDNGTYGLLCHTSAKDQKLLICSRDKYISLLRQWVEVRNP